LKRFSPGLGHHSRADKADLSSLEGHREQKSCIIEQKPKAVSNLQLRLSLKNIVMVGGGADRTKPNSSSSKVNQLLDQRRPKHKDGVASNAILVN